jgi:uncharacterized protein with GYD domain
LDAMFERGALRAVLELVGHGRGYRGIEGVTWVDVVLSKFNEVGVKTVKDFVNSVMTMNNLLQLNGHQQMHTETLTAMLRECADMMLGPESDEEADRTTEDEAERAGMATEDEAEFL